MTRPRSDERYKPMPPHSSSTIFSLSSQLISYRLCVCLQATTTKVVEVEQIIKGLVDGSELLATISFAGSAVSPDLVVEMEDGCSQPDHSHRHGEIENRVRPSRMKDHIKAFAQAGKFYLTVPDKATAIDETTSKAAYMYIQYVCCIDSIKGHACGGRMQSED